jgi:hypothetical protein
MSAIALSKLSNTLFFNDPSLVQILPEHTCDRLPGSGTALLIAMGDLGYLPTGAVGAEGHNTYSLSR